LIAVKLPEAILIAVNFVGRYDISPRRRHAIFAHAGDDSRVLVR
jgi:hypothetical protein